MPLFTFDGITPDVHPDAWVAPTATLIGDVQVEANASIWYGAVLRADFAKIIVRAGANVQDNTVIHGGPDAIIIGAGATVGHSCIVHNAVIGAETLIGNGAILQDGCRIGDRCLIGAAALVPPNMVVADEQMVLGTPGTVRGKLTDTARWWVENNGPAYQDLAARHRDTIKEAG